MAIEIPTKAAIEVIASDRMMPSFSFPGWAFQLFAFVYSQFEMRFLPKINCPKIQLGWMVLGVHEVFWILLIAASNCCRRNHQENDYPPKNVISGSGFTMDRRMIFISWSLRTFNRPNQNGRKKHIYDRFDTIGNQKRKNYRRIPVKTWSQQKHTADHNLKITVRGSLKRGSRHCAKLGELKSKRRATFWDFPKANTMQFPRRSKLPVKPKAKSNSPSISKDKLKIPKNRNQITALRMK